MKLHCGSLLTQTWTTVVFLSVLTSRKLEWTKFGNCLHLSLVSCLLLLNFEHSSPIALYLISFFVDGILHYQGIRGAEYVHRLASNLPILNLSVETQPVTRSILRITARLTADFTWVDCHHGNAGTLLYWLWVEDPDSACIYHSEVFLLTKKMVSFSLRT